MLFFGIFVLDLTIALLCHLMIPNLSIFFQQGERGPRHRDGSRSMANIRPTKTLFVINFDPIRTRVRDIERHFEPYGKILNVRIRRNFAFVQFETQEEASKALDCTNMRLASLLSFCFINNFQAEMVSPIVWKTLVFIFLLNNIKSMLLMCICACFTFTLTCMSLLWQKLDHVTYGDAYWSAGILVFGVAYLLNFFVIICWIFGSSASCPLIITGWFLCPASDRGFLHALRVRVCMCVCDSLAHTVGSTCIIHDEDEQVSLHS